MGVVYRYHLAAVFIQRSTSSSSSPILPMPMPSSIRLGFLDGSRVAIPSGHTSRLWDSTTLRPPTMTPSQRLNSPIPSPIRIGCRFSTTLSSTDYDFFSTFSPLDSGIRPRFALRLRHRLNAFVHRLRLLLNVYSGIRL